MKRTKAATGSTAARSLKMASDALKLAGRAGVELAKGEGEDQEEDDGVGGEVGEVAALRGEIPRQKVAYVQRRQPGGTYAILDKISPSAVSQPYFMEAYGGGSYRIEIRGPKKLANGKIMPNVILEQIMLEVDSSIPPKAPPSQRATVAGAGGSAAPQTAGDLSQMAVANFITQSANSSLATMNMVNAMIAGMMEMVKNMSRRERDPLVEKLLDSAISGSKRDPIEQLLQLTELRDKLTGGGGDGNGRNAWDVAHEYLPLFLEALRRGETPQLPPGEQAPPGPEVTAPAGGGDPMAVIFSLIAPALPRLLKHAAAGHDPQTWAEATLDEIPEQHYPVVFEALQEPGFLDAVIAKFPPVGAHRQWFEDLIAAALEALQPEDALEEPAAAPPGGPKPAA